jgi:integrase
LGGVHVRKLTPLHLSDLYERLLREGRRDARPGGLSPRTVGHVHRALHRMLKQAVRWDLAARNVASDLELPSVTPAPMITITQEQAQELLVAAEGTWKHTMVLLALATGARLGELLALRWADVDLDAGELRICRSRRVVRRRVEVKTPKTDAGARTVVLGPATLMQLRRLHADQAARRLALGAAYHADEDLVICKPDGRPYRPDSASTMFRELARKVGLPDSVHVHTLRHSAASWLAAAGVPASDIAAQLGHADGGQLALKVYIHPMAEGLARAGAHLDRAVDGGGRPGDAALSEQAVEIR